MRSGKDIVLDTRNYVQESRWRSWWEVLSSFMFLAVTEWLACTSPSLLVSLPSCFLAGVIIVRIFIIYHDYQHGALLRDSPLADMLMSTIGMILLCPPATWKHTHDGHHKSNAQKFGATLGTYTLITTEEYAQASRRERLSYSISRHPITILFGYVTVFVWEMCVRNLICEPKKHRGIFLALLVHASLIASAAIWSWQALLLGMIIPMAIATGLGSYLFYAQHNFPDMKLRHGDDWSYIFAALRSSSFMKMSRMMHWFTGNIGYHHIHHLNAKIPFYRLPEAMAGIDELRSPGTTSLRLRDVARCLSLKLWDAELDRLVTFREAATRQAF